MQQQDIHPSRSPTSLSLMAPFYRLTLFLFACIAYWGGTSCFSGSAMATVENSSQRLRETTESVSILPSMEMSDLGRSSLSGAIAQNNPEKPASKDPKTQPQPKKSSFRLPKSLILGVGALILTGGAILILIRLISPPDEVGEKVVDVEAQTVSPSPPPASVPVKAIKQGESQTAPTVIQPNPAEVVLEQNGSRDGGTQGSIADPPSTKPTTSETPLPVKPLTDTVNLQLSSSGPKVDPQEQWISDLKQLNPDVRSNAIWELAQTGDSRAIQPLLELLIHSDSNQRSLVLAALSEIGTRTFKPLNRALSLSLQDENAEVRKNAIRDLSRIYDLAAQMSQILQRAVDDPDPEVQEIAKWAIHKLSRLNAMTRSDQPPSL